MCLRFLCFDFFFCNIDGSQIDGVFVFNSFKNLICQPQNKHFIYVLMKVFGYLYNLLSFCFAISTFNLTKHRSIYSNNAANWRCNTPCSSRSSFIFLPNIIVNHFKFIFARKIARKSLVIFIILRATKLIYFLVYYSRFFAQL